MKYYIDLFFQYLMKKRYLYRIIGWSAFIYLAFELATPQLPDEVIPDYTKFKEKYGELPAAMLGYFVRKHASGSDTTTVYVLLVVVLACLFVEMRINKVTGKGTRNNFFGFIQNINQTYNEKDDNQ